MSESTVTRIDRDLLLVAGCLILGAVMSILDTTVINVAIRRLAEDFDAPLTTIQWVVTGYTLALALVIPLSAWGSDRLGAKRLYLVSVVLFVAGSALSGLAWNAGSLIGFRVLQGLGGGMLMPTAMTILTRAAGPARIGRVMSVIGVPMLLGPIGGPILGGWLIDDFSWRWIFFINLPIGALALVSAWLVLKDDEPQPAAPLDWRGLVTLSPGLALVIYGLAESGNQGGFGHARVLVPIVAGAVLLVAFVRNARRGDHPLIDLGLFRNRVFTGASLALVFTVIALFGGLLLVPLYFQSVRGESALATGLLLVPQGVGALVGMPVAGILADRTGIGRIVPAGLLVIAAAFAGLTTLGADTSYRFIGVVLFVMGIGMGFTMMPLMSGALQTLRKRDIAHATTAVNIEQQVAASIGTAVMVVVFAHISAGNPGASAFGETFWWALGFVMVAFVVAVALLPRGTAPVQPRVETVVLPRSGME